jgi:RimJ/RimL family protein N-acetyltransferase
MPADALLEPALLRLRVHAPQRDFVGRIADLLADAQSRPSCEPMAILLGAESIGFYCIETVARCIVGRDFEEPALGLRGFFLAAQWQGQGLGAQALQLLLADLAARHPQARLLVLTVGECNRAALALYRRAGFVDSGERYHGGRSGPQLLLRRALP